MVPRHPLRISAQYGRDGCQPTEHSSVATGRGRLPVASSGRTPLSSCRKPAALVWSPRSKTVESRGASPDIRSHTFGLCWRDVGSGAVGEGVGRRGRGLTSAVAMIDRLILIKLCS